MRFSFKDFKMMLKKANPTFSRVKLSSMETLIDALGGEYDERRGNDWRTLNDRQIDLVQRCIFALIEDKRVKYKHALKYLADELDVAIKPTEEIVVAGTLYNRDRIFKVGGTIIGDRYNRAGGWKIHVSAHPHNCVRTARLILPRLSTLKEWHKYVASPQALENMPRRQKGKFITIYTRSPEHCDNLVKIIEVMLHPRGLTGPPVTSDIPVGTSRLLSKRLVPDFTQADLEDEDDDDEL